MHGYIYTLPPKKKSGQPNPTPVLPQHFKIAWAAFFFGWGEGRATSPLRWRRPQEYIPDNQIQLTALGQKQGEAAGEQIRTLVGNSTVPWGQTTKRNAAMICWNPERNGNTTFFPTCQVRVVRFYVSLFSSSSSFSFSFSFSFSSASSSVSLSCCDSVCSVWHVGPQLRSCEFCVACWTSTAILWVQCGVPDRNRDPASSVWRAGPQPRSCEFSGAYRTSTAIMRVQCGVPDPNCDHASSVGHTGPQPRLCEFSVACRTPTAIMRVECGVPDLNGDGKDW